MLGLLSLAREMRVPSLMRAWLIPERMFVGFSGCTLVELDLLAPRGQARLRSLTVWVKEAMASGPVQARAPTARHMVASGQLVITTEEALPMAVGAGTCSTSRMSLAG